MAGFSVPSPYLLQEFNIASDGEGERLERPGEAHFQHLVAEASEGDVYAGPGANFNTGFEPNSKKYDITLLLRCREAMPATTQPTEVSHLKFLIVPGHGAEEPATERDRGHEEKDRRRDRDRKARRKEEKEKHANNGGSSSRGARDVADIGSSETLPGHRGTSWRGDDERDRRRRRGKEEKAGGADENSGGGSNPGGRQVADMGSTEIISGFQRGTCWRNIGKDRLDVIVREHFSLSSAEILRVPPGHYVHQAGPAEVFVSGQAKGLQRMPILPRGWVTVDATSVGGPRYLEVVRSARWRVVFSSGSTKGDVVVRSGASLESREVAVLFFGTVVEQTGPHEVFEDGIERMPIVFQSREPSSPSEERGWVTRDATAKGGPRFFAPCGDTEPMRPPTQTPSSLASDFPVEPREPFLNSHRSAVAASSGGGDARGAPYEQSSRAPGSRNW
uniref:Uncharacterized protein n=1 Tax=Noctiluca scintillans TaxID=2966 RepID=A0A7S0ZTZ2_NOCSC